MMPLLCAKKRYWRLPKSVPGQKRKSRTMILMSVKPPKAEVAHAMRDVCFVPIVLQKSVAILCEQ